jgi:hypothetical protein
MRNLVLSVRNQGEINQNGFVTGERVVFKKDGEIIGYLNLAEAVGTIRVRFEFDESVKIFREDLLTRMANQEVQNNG